MAVTNWITASFRDAAAGSAQRRWSASRSGARLPTGEVVAVATNDVVRIGGAFDVAARLVGAIVSYIVVAVILLNTSTCSARRAGRRAR